MVLNKFPQKQGPSVYRSGAIDEKIEKKSSMYHNYNSFIREEDIASQNCKSKSWPRSYNRSFVMHIKIKDKDIKY